MRRPALAGAGSVLVLVLLIVGWSFLTRDRDLLTTTPQPSPLVAVALVPLTGGAQACLDTAVMDEHSERVLFRVGTYGKRAMPLRVTIRGRGYRDGGRVAAADYGDNDLISVPVGAPRTPRFVTVCIRNEGSRRIALYGAADRTRSRSNTLVDGTRVGSNVVIQFAEGRPRSLLGHVPTILQRLTIFRPVGEALLWPLAILFGLGIPAAVMTAYVRSVDSAEEEDAESARQASGAPPREWGSLPLARFVSKPWFWLAAIIGLIFLIGVGYTSSIVNYFVMSDELGYVKQASHIASSLSPNTPGDMWFNSYSQLWPLVIAPGYGLFETPAAFDIAHMLAALAIASTAIPAYLLARRLIDGHVGPLFAAALTVAVPWLAFSGSLMTESLGYPLFVWALLACTAAIARPSPARDALALGAILLAFLTRPQLAVLVVALLGAVALHEVMFSDSAGRRRPRLPTREQLSRHWLLLALVAGGLVLAVAGVSPRDVLGNYSSTTEGGLFVDGMVQQGRELLAYIALGVAVLPIALAPAWIVLELARPRHAATHAFAALSLTTILTMVVVTSSFSVRFTAGINDRYLFFIAPLLTIGTVALLFDRRPATLPLAAGGAVAAAIFGGVALTATGPSLVSPTYALNTVVQGRGLQVADALGFRGVSAADLLAVGIVVVVVALALARRRWPGARPVAIAVCVALLLVSVSSTRYVLKTIEATQAGASPAFIDGRNWLDRTAPGEENVGAVLSLIDNPAVSAASWWDLSFWNKRLDRVWSLPDSDIYSQGFASPALVDPATGRMAALDERPLLIVGAADRRFALRGVREIAATGPFKLVRAPRPYRAAWSLDADRDDGLIAAGGRARLSLFGDGRRARTVRVRLSASTTPDATRGYRLSVRGASGQTSVRVPKGAGGTLRAMVRVPRIGAARLNLRVSGRARKAGVTGVIVAPVVTPRG